MANIANFSRRADELPEQEYSLIPDGQYNADIEKAELRQTKDGTGQYINLQMKILGPTQGGRVVFGTINIQNKSEKAEEIGLRQLKEVKAACGLAALRDTDELVGRQIKVKIKTQPEKDGYPARNTVAGYSSVSGNTMPMPAGGSTPPTAASSTPPWARK
jgi:hypothetical protein